MAYNIEYEIKNITDKLTRKEAETEKMKTLYKRLKNQSL
jgi:hypothetical protein